MTKIHIETGRPKHSKTGNFQHYREVADVVSKWCASFFYLKDVKEITLHLHNDKNVDCWGECDGGDDSGIYDVSVYVGQNLRDFVATIVHEFVHIKQWESGSWDGDGEAEANYLQYAVTDRMWKLGVL